MEATISSEALRHNGPPRAGLATMRAAASKRRAGLETRDAEADLPAKQGRLPSVGKRVTRAPTGSAGVLAAARMEGGNGRNTGSPVWWRGTRQPTAREGQVGGRVAERPTVPVKSGNADRGKGPWFENTQDGGRDVGTGESLTASEKVQRLQRALHAKAKEAPGLRFYTLSDQGVACRRSRGRLGRWSVVTAALRGWTARRWRTSRRSVWIAGWGYWRGT